MSQTIPTPVYVRTTVSGDYVETWMYEKPIFIHGSGGYPLPTSRKYPCDYLRKQAALRAQQNIKRTILSNWGQYGKNTTTKFLTLTFAENIIDRKIANRYFDNFLKRLRRRYGKLFYLAVPERQKRGAWHYHVIFFNLPFVPWQDMISLWKYGGIYIEKVHNALHCSRYISKYLSKDDRKKNEKSVYMSIGLIRSETVYGYTSGLTSDYKKLYSSEYDGEYTGRVVYSCYYVGNKDEKFLNKK